MSDGAISQAEIDALLSGVDMGGLSAGGSSMIVPNVNIDTTILTGFPDEVKENLAQSLKTMTGKEVIADVPMVEALGRDQVLAKIPEVVVAVMADFNATLNGDHLFIFSPEFAQKLIGLINKEDEPDLSEMGLSIISEVVAQHSGSEITALTKDGKLSGLAANAPEAVHQPKPMVRMPQGIFKGVRTMTANIVIEMGYATDLHREALIATGVVLFVFILIINLLFSILKRKKVD